MDKNNEEKLILIHYGELGLKKGNRGFFESHLRNNIKHALGDLPYKTLKSDYGRLILTLPDNAPVKEITDRLKNVIGIAHFSVAYRGSSDVEVLKEQIYQKLKYLSFNTFCINTRRADKQYPLTSMQVNQIVGEKIHETMQKPVKMKNPDLKCTIEIYNKKVRYAYERIEGQRGLPVRTGGNVVCLLSSGIDSPVAMYRMMTRGCKVIPVHFHSYPFTDKSSYYNTIRLARLLTRYQNMTRLYLVPLIKLQEAIIIHTPARLRLLLYRRMMFRLAERVAQKENALALITGESLGQVASQTLENITAVSAVVNRPILRPLIGMDKETIIIQAREIGTFETSIEPYDDCCSYLVPENPETRARLIDIERAESRLGDFETLLEDALEKTEIMKLQFPPRE